MLEGQIRLNDDRYEFSSEAREHIENQIKRAYEWIELGNKLRQQIEERKNGALTLNNSLQGVAATSLPRYHLSDSL